MDTDLTEYDDIDVTEYNEYGDPIDIVYDDEEQIGYEYAQREKYYPIQTLTPEERQELLFQRISQMDEYEYNMLLKTVRCDNINELMDAMSNLKSTSESTWKNIISKLQFLLKFNDTETSKFDFNKLLKILIPLIAALAGLLIALRKSEKAEAEAADVPIDTTENPILAYMMKPDEEKEKDEDDELDPITGKLKSVVLSQCNKMINGFSY